MAEERLEYRLINRPESLIQRSEWRWVFIWTLAVLLLTTVPYMTGWFTAIRTGATFTGFVIGVDDGNSYLAKMSQGARGEWLFHIVYTSEPHDGRLVFLFHLLLGKLAAVITPVNTNLSLRMIWIYHLTRIIFSSLLLALTYRFVSEFTAVKTGRRLAWLMVAMGGGLGWLLVALGQDNWLSSMPLDFILPEGFTFLTMFTLPHIALARSLFLAGLLVWIQEIGQAGQTGFWSSVIRLGCCWFFMGLIVPFYPLVGGVVMLATIVVLWISRKAFPTREALLSISAGVIVLPVVGYSSYILLTDPVMRGWSAQNLILSPSPLHFLAAYISPALAAALGLCYLFRNPVEKYWLLVAWVLIIPPLLYLPFNLQRRLVEGYQLPLYTLAAIGLSIKLVKTRIEKILTVCLLILMFPTTIMLVAGSTAVAASGRAPLYLSPAQVEMAQWLQQHTPEGTLVLSAYRTGNYLPAWAPVRVYFGHSPETIDFEQKRANVERFYGDSDDTGWRYDFLEVNQIDYFVCGPAERELGDTCNWIQPTLEPVFERAGWILYSVEMNHE